MKVLLVNGSPHEQGCTNRALEELQAQFAREDAEAEIFWLGKSMQPCIACNRCAGLGRCVFDDRVCLWHAGLLFGCKRRAGVLYEPAFLCAWEKADV